MLQKYRYALYCFEIFTSNMKGYLLYALRAASECNKTVLSNQPLPLLNYMSLIVAITLVTRGHLDAGLSFSLGFYGYLRANEITKLHFQDVCFPRDSRLEDFGQEQRVGCKLDKTGKNQYDSICNPTLLRRIERQHCRRSVHGNSVQFFFPFSNPSLTKALRIALQVFGLVDVGYTPHSLPYGVATYDWLRGASMQYKMKYSNHLSPLGEPMVGDFHIKLGFTWVWFSFCELRGGELQLDRPNFSSLKR